MEFEEIEATDQRCMPAAKLFELAYKHWYRLLVNMSYKAVRDSSNALEFKDCLSEAGECMWMFINSHFLTIDDPRYQSVSFEALFKKKLREHFLDMIRKVQAPMRAARLTTSLYRETQGGEDQDEDQFEIPIACPPIQLDSLQVSDLIDKLELILDLEARKLLKQLTNPSEELETLNLTMGITDMTIPHVSNLSIVMKWSRRKTQYTLDRIRRALEYLLHSSPFDEVVVGETQ